jgi:hypothetical protein
MWSDYGVQLGREVLLPMWRESGVTGGRCTLGPVLTRQLCRIYHLGLPLATVLKPNSFPSLENGALYGIYPTKNKNIATKRKKIYIYKAVGVEKRVLDVEITRKGRLIYEMRSL